MSPTILDTCCFINVCASQHPLAIIRAAFGEVMIPKNVIEESLFLRQPSADAPHILVPSPIRHDALLAEGAIRIVGFESESEMDLFVRLAAAIDDGEAACLALASSRGLALATDERKAIALARDLDLRVVTTPEILMKWIEAASPEAGIVMEVIRNIETYGRFKPRRSSVHSKWWNDHGPSRPNG
jgi:predicted nucleic acid-binding protein